MINISVVIPTRNRLQSLLKTLAGLENQLYPLAEVIIVDSSDQKQSAQYFNELFSALNIIYIPSRPSVCLQRNIGIKKALSEYIFLCDDDIETPPDYVSILIEHIKKINAGAISGLVLQKIKGTWQSDYPLQSFGQLLWQFIFQLSIWSNIHSFKTSAIYTKIYHHIKIGRASCRERV